jgi:cytochrome b561
MSIRNSSARWGAVSQSLHWLIALLIFTQIALGLTMKAFLRPGPTFFAIIGIHKSIGITILALVVIRLLWRLMNPVPGLPATLEPYERVLALFTHAALYVILFAMPLSGWIGSSAGGHAVRWFNLFPVPNLVGKSRPLAGIMGTTHEVLAICLVLVLTLHIAAALRHHFVLEDDTLRRMLPGSAKGTVAEVPDRQEA